ncbi:hypothetical protein B0T14DRAFT_74032 [Immersiella caudata]|uniref:Uncharacterized protein n=1 Tax=Immersiella caudata TaxID=314043 RepID=A0AA39XH65_9PEZI|nr:hypothetical protein B0T14DRAFT_74032 [Immersiella caudata]
MLSVRGSPKVKRRLGMTNLDSVRADEVKKWSRLWWCLRASKEAVRRPGSDGEGWAATKAKLFQSWLEMLHYESLAIPLMISLNHNSRAVNLRSRQPHSENTPSLWSSSQNRDRDQTKTLFARALCRLTALYAALATVCTTFATFLAEETTAHRGQTTLKTAVAAALTRWRLLLVLHWGLWRIVALLLRRATVSLPLRVLRVLRLWDIALGRRPLVVVLRGRHGCVGRI